MQSRLNGAEHPCPIGLCSIGFFLKVFCQNIGHLIIYLSLWNNVFNKIFKDRETTYISTYEFRKMVFKVTHFNAINFLDYWLDVTTRYPDASKIKVRFIMAIICFYLHQKLAATKHRLTIKA